MWELMIQSKVSEKMSFEESQKIRLNLQIFPTDHDQYSNFYPYLKIMTFLVKEMMKKQMW